MTFRKFADAVHKRYDELAKGELFVVEVEDIFATYLAAFPDGTNPIYRQRTVHDCQCCKHFLRRLGIVVGISPDKHILTLWDDMDKVPYPFNVVAAKLGEIVRQAPIRGVFRTKEPGYGMDHNFDSHNDERHDHFHGQVSGKHQTPDPETKRGEYDAIAKVMKRGLTEINLEDIDAVLELVNSNALYRGEDNRAALEGFRKLRKEYDGTDLYVWANLENRAARLRNTSIGTLLLDLATGGELEDAVRKYEAMVAPQNYKRTTSLITPRMVNEAAATLERLGLEGAIHRRYARLSDVSVNDILFVDNKTRPKMAGGKKITDILADQVSKPSIDIERAAQIGVKDFVESVVPYTKSMAVLVKNSHLGNFVSLTGGDGPERLFKWGNNFAWSYDGEVTDSIKARVKAAGGNVNAKLRVSLSWFNYDDLDLHAWTPRGDHIHYANKMGILDVDMNAAGRKDSRSPVENLAFNLLHDGVYRIVVNNYLKQESIDVGFIVEVEYERAIHQFSYASAVRNQQHVDVVKLTVRNGILTNIDAEKHMVGGSIPTEKWGVTTEQLVPVSVLMNSPNHWNGSSVGAKHWFFMLEGCKNPGQTRGIYNEFLRPDLEKHRKVFEVLGGKTKCPETDDQISGLGFTSARGDSVVVVTDNRKAYHVTF